MLTVLLKSGRVEHVDAENWNREGGGGSHGDWILTDDAGKVVARFADDAVAGIKRRPDSIKPGGRAEGRKL